VEVIDAAHFAGKAGQLFQRLLGGPGIRGVQSRLGLRG